METYKKLSDTELEITVGETHVVTQEELLRLQEIVTRRKADIENQLAEIKAKLDALK